MEALIKQNSKIGFAIEQELEIGTAFKKLVNLRGEKFSDYVVDEFLEQFKNDGYTYDEAIKIIESGINLEKYGNTKLAYGNLIAAYEEANPDRINWDTVKRGIEKICEKDIKTLNEVSMKITGVRFISQEERQVFYDFLKDEVEAEATRKVEKERQAIDNEAEILNNAKERNENLEKAKVIKNEYVTEILEEVGNRIVSEKADTFRALKIIKAKIRNL